MQRCGRVRPVLWPRSEGLHRQRYVHPYRHLLLERRLHGDRRDLPAARRHLPVSRWRDSVQRPASNFDSCISSSYCCTDTDCAGLAGATCPTPGQSCQCANGQKACISTKSCIPQTSCCTAAGECCDDPLGKSCGGATAQAALSLGGSVTAQGLLTAAGEEDWISSHLQQRVEHGLPRASRLQRQPEQRVRLRPGDRLQGHAARMRRGRAVPGEDGMGGALHGGRSHRADLGAHLGRDRVHPRLPAERRSTHLRSVGAHDQRVTG